MITEKQIEDSIKQTCVVVNDAGIKYAVKRIMELIKKANEKQT